jgi:pimeloyl-ACP methyl ester carboxylesterase
LSGPARPGAALYLHGIEVTGGYFHLPVPGYDHVYEMARLGHVSVVIDRLGYGASGRPPGTMTCTGAQADVAHQVAEELRSGAYEMTGGGAPPRFERVALVGHSGGAIAAQVAMYSFGDFAAGIVMGFHDQLPGSTIATEGLTGEAPRCAAGGVPADGDSGPPGYAYLFTSTAAWSHATMADGTPEVLAALAPLRRRTPCGELETDLLVSPFDNLHLGEVHIPVLLLYGERDLLFPYSGAPAQRGHYTGTRDVTFVGFPGGGHQFFLDRGVASQVRAVMSRWLSIRGF